MPNVVFAAPLLSDNAIRMIEATANLPHVRVGVISQDWPDHLPPSIRAGIVAHWRLDDVLDAAALADAAQRLSLQVGPLDHLFGAYEQLQLPLAEARERLGIAGMSSEVARNFRDKSLMKTRLREAGLPCAGHRLVTREGEAWAFADEVGYPLVVKPPAGAGAVATFQVDGPEGMRSALATTPAAPENPLLLEEFVTGDEHSLETISIGGRAVWHSLTRYLPSPLEVLRNPWIQWSVILPREVDDPRYDDIRAAGAKAIEVLGMDTGLTHMEWFRRPNGGLAISEVAARPPGAQITTLVSRANDIDFVSVWARLMVFGTFEPPVRRYAVGAVFLRGQGSGRVTAVRGLDQAMRELGSLIVDVQWPSIGQPKASGYEGEGFVIVRHPETRVVEQAVDRLHTLVRVDLG